jgi:hypothetical protein
MSIVQERPMFGVRFEEELMIARNNDLVAVRLFDLARAKRIP